MKQGPCIYCKHFYFETGIGAYSEYTPGEDAELGCRKYIWLLGEYDWGENEFRDNLSRGYYCDQFEYIPMSEIPK